MTRTHSSLHLDSMEGAMDLPGSEAPQAHATNPPDVPSAAEPFPNPPLNPTSQPSNALQTYLSTTNNHIHRFSRYIVPLKYLEAEIGS